MLTDLAVQPGGRGGVTGGLGQWAEPLQRARHEVPFGHASAASPSPAFIFRW